MAGHCGGNCSCRHNNMIENSNLIDFFNGEDLSAEIYNARKTGRFLLY